MTNETIVQMATTIAASMGSHFGYAEVHFDTIAERSVKLAQKIAQQIEGSVSKNPTESPKVETIKPIEKK